MLRTTFFLRTKYSEFTVKRCSGINAVGLIPSSKHLTSCPSFGCDRHSELKSFHDDDHSLVNVFKQSFRHATVVALSQQWSFTPSMPSFSICDMDAGADVSFCSVRSLCKKHCQNRSWNRTLSIKSDTKHNALQVGDNRQDFVYEVWMTLTLH